jgi:choline dehydrogenase-like flavoprotein
MPSEANRLTLDPNLKDRHGIAAPALHYRVDANAQAQLDHGIASARQVFEAAGAQSIHVKNLMPDAGFHLMGTARMGDDPAASVVDRWGRAHDVDNLFVVDGSVFVTCAALNPTPTIQALALRTADHIIQTRGAAN